VQDLEVVDALGDGDDGIGAALQFVREKGRVVCFFLEDECGEPVWTCLSVGIWVMEMEIKSLWEYVQRNDLFALKLR